jgi:hypothetical protein
MKFEKKLTFLFVFFCMNICGEMVELHFEDALIVSPFEKSIMECMSIQETLTSLLQRDYMDKSLMQDVCKKLIRLHAQCVRLHDASLSLAPEDVDYLQGWFMRLSEQIQLLDIGSCMVMLLRESQKLLV